MKNQIYTRISKATHYGITVTRETNLYVLWTGLDTSGDGPNWEVMATYTMYQREDALEAAAAMWTNHTRNNQE